MAYSERELLARIIECEAGGEGDNRYESSCNGGLIANYSPSNEKALQIAEKCRLVETKTISKIFKNIKEKGILDKNIDIEITKINDNKEIRKVCNEPIKIKDNK